MLLHLRHAVHKTSLHTATPSRSALKWCCGMPVQVQSSVEQLMPTVANCTFVRNHAARHGGAIAVTSVTGAFAVHDSAFDGNTACSGGGAIATSTTADVLVQNTVFSNQSSVLMGCNGATMWSGGEGGAILHVRVRLTFSVHAITRQTVLLTWHRIKRSHVRVVGACVRACLQAMEGPALSCPKLHVDCMQFGCAPLTIMIILALLTLFCTPTGQRGSFAGD